jgi:hypothetical protein
LAQDQGPEASGDEPGDEGFRVTGSRTMTRRHAKNPPSFELIQNKRGEAEWYLYRLKEHREQQRRPEKPAPYEFAYKLSAFLNAARSVGKMLARKRRNAGRKETD